MKEWSEGRFDFCFAIHSVRKPASCSIRQEGCSITSKRVNEPLPLEVPECIQESQDGSFHCSAIILRIRAGHNTPPVRESLVDHVSKYQSKKPSRKVYPESRWRKGAFISSPHLSTLVLGRATSTSATASVLGIRGSMLCHSASVTSVRYLFLVSLLRLNNQRHAVEVVPAKQE